MDLLQSSKALRSSLRLVIVVLLMIIDHHVFRLTQKTLGFASPLISSTQMKPIRLGRTCNSTKILQSIQTNDATLKQSVIFIQTTAFCPLPLNKIQDLSVAFLRKCDCEIDEIRRFPIQIQDSFIEQYNLYLMDSDSSFCSLSCDEQEVPHCSIKIKSLENRKHLILIDQEEDSCKITFTTLGTGTGHCIRIQGNDIPSTLKTFGLTTRQKLATAIIKNQVQIKVKYQQIWLRIKHSGQWLSLNLEEPVDLEKHELLEIGKFYYNSNLSKNSKKPLLRAFFQPRRRLQIEQ